MADSCRPGSELLQAARLALSFSGHFAGTVSVDVSFALLLVKQQTHQVGVIRETEVLPYSPRRPAEHRRTALDNHNDLACHPQMLGVVSDDHHGMAVQCICAENVHYLAVHTCVEAGRRLIEHEQRW